MKNLLFVFLYIGAQFSLGADLDKQVTVNITVSDQGTPVENATVRVGFEQNFDWDKGATQVVSTGTNGNAKVSEECSNGVFLRISKDHYYQHTENWKLYSSILEGAVSTNCNVSLKRVKEPASMYAKREKRIFPKTEGFIGYDFEVGDWIAPHGKGQTTDVLFKPYFTSTDRYNYSVKLEVKFPGEYNGIQLMPREFPERQGSALRSAQVAPENGYADVLNMSRFRKGRTVDDGDFSEVDREGYYFRIRSIVDAQGNLVSAHYGKIYGSFDVYGGILGHELGLAFFYYYNPDTTRNVEFDPKQNLFLKGHKGRVPTCYSIGNP